MNWERTDIGRYEAQADSGRIYQVLRSVGSEWRIVTSDGVLTGQGFGSAKVARAYCESFETKGI